MSLPTQTTLPPPWGCPLHGGNNRTREGVARTDDLRPRRSTLTSLDDGQGFSRRAFLRVGALGLGGLALPWLLQARAAASGTRGLVKDRSVISLFLHGGPSPDRDVRPQNDGAGR